MEKAQEKTNPWYYFPFFILAAVLVVFIFLSGYQRGVSIGKRTPPPLEKPGGQVATVDLRKLRLATPEATAKGKMLFLTNCASCHGPEGRGDGERAAELSPRPRNYHTEKFKFGAAPIQIYNTVTTGSPGTSMPAFELLPPEDRWALVHFVRTQIPNPPDDSPEEIAKLPGGEGGPASVTTTPLTQPTVPVPAAPRIPIALAMQKLALPAPEPGEKLSVPAHGQGATIYSRNCVTCHGGSGEGGRKTIYLLRLKPYVYVKSKSLQEPDRPWRQDKNEFMKIVTKGFPGQTMPGFGTLTRREIDALYEYVLNFAAPKKNGNKS
jgi:mono/diheme cytochrome c family protein